MLDASPLSRIRAIDYSVIFVRDMNAMRRFYEEVMRFPIHKVLYEGWVEYRVGSNILALAYKTLTAEDAPAPQGAASLQLAFRVAPAEVAQCAVTLAEAGVAIVQPTTDQAWGHRTLFFRDPDGNLLEIYADI